MKKLIIFIAVMLFGYSARVEPFDAYNIKASVGGKVIKTFKNLENKNLKNALIIKLDDKQELIELKNIKNQIEILKQKIKNQLEIIKRKKSIYERYKNLKTKSIEAKNMKFYDYINAKNQLLSLKSSLSSLIANKEKLEDIIDKKNIKYTGYLSEIMVSKDDYAAPGMIVAKGYDINRQKLYIYVPINKIDTIKNKKVYINNKLSNFKIYKIWIVPDSKYITSYKVELVGNGLKFGDIVEVKFKGNL